MLLKELLSNASIGINEIRLRDLLTVRSCVNEDVFIRSMFPPVGMGSITLVDQIVLLSLSQIFNPKVIVEVGTFLGFTTALLALNSNARVYSIDLPISDYILDLQFDADLIHTDAEQNDNFLRNKQALQGEVYLDRLPPEVQDRISLIKADSTTLSFKEQFRSAQFVFIDGGHSRAIIESDSLNARSIVESGVIVWHDFGSRIHTQVTEYLSHETNRKIFHVKDSMCAFEIISAERDRDELA